MKIFFDLVLVLLVGYLTVRLVTRVLNRAIRTAQKMSLIKPPTPYARDSGPRPYFSDDDPTSISDLIRKEKERQAHIVN